MRIAFVSIPHFACAVEVSRNPRLAGLPLIVGDAEQPKLVLDCSVEAEKWGVQRGMPVRKALGACPDAVIVPPDPVVYRSLWQAALAAFAEISPEVEDEELGRAYINVAGLHSHYGDEQDLAQRIAIAANEATALDASVGIASGKLLAFAAANVASAGESLLVPVGTEAEFLREQPVELLPVEAGVISRLRLLGLYLLGEVAQLSVPELQSQFGFEGKRIWQLANGIDEIPLCPQPHAEGLAASFAFEAPVAGIEVMIAVARQLLSRLRPSILGKAVRELTLQAELASGRGWERQLVMREAVSEEQRLLFVIRTLLDNFPPPQAIRSLTLLLKGLTREMGSQFTLGEGHKHQPQLEEAIRQLKARYGCSPVYRCVEVEPWSAIPEERWILVESDG